VIATVSLLGCAADPPPRNAILIVLDTLRADRLSAYVNERATSPAIDGLAERGVLFETVVSNASWTLPAMAGLLSGSYPTRAEYDRKLRSSLVARLRDAGWKTAAFTGGGLAGTEFGMNLGFDHFEEQDPRDLALPVPGRPAASRPGSAPRAPEIDTTFAAARRWLEANRDSRFFLMVHTYEPHTPYRRTTFARDLERGSLPPTFEVDTALRIRLPDSPLELGRTELEYIGALYDGGVRESDRHVGELLAHLDRLGLGNDTLVVVTSDHGEDLGEGQPPTPGNHGHALWDSLILVPLVIFDPTREYPVDRVLAQARSIDTLPTVLDLLGIDADGTSDGRSLRPLMEGKREAERPGWSVLDRGLRPGQPVKMSLRSGTHKLVASVASESADATERSIELYDLTAGPGEARDVAATDPARVEAMLATLDSFHRHRYVAGVPRFKPDGATMRAALRRLRELGYAQ